MLPLRYSTALIAMGSAERFRRSLSVVPRDPRPQMEHTSHCPDEHLHQRIQFLFHYASGESFWCDRHMDRGVSSGRPSFRIMAGLGSGRVLHLFSARPAGHQRFSSRPSPSLSRSTSGECSGRLTCGSSGLAHAELLLNLEPLLSVR